MTIDDTFRKAAQLYGIGKIDEAVVACREVLAANPRHFDALHLLGVMRAQTGDAEEAVRLIGEALKIKPSSVRAEVNLGNILAGLDRKDEALSCFDAAVTLQPNNAALHFSRANLLWEMDRCEEAAAGFERTAVLEPSRAEVLVNLSSVLQELRRYEDALKACEHAIALAPDMPEGHNNRGNALLKLGRTEEALESYEHALALKPNHLMASYNRGNALSALKRKEQALESYSKAITIDPDFALAYKGLASVLIGLKKPMEALEECARAIKLDPTLVEAYNCRAYALNALKQFQEAISACDAALILKPDCAEAYAIRGAMHRELGMYDEAIASLDRAIALDPGAADAFYNRSGTLNDLKRSEEALCDCERALALNPNFMEAMGWRLFLASYLCAWHERDKMVSDIYRCGREDLHINPFHLLPACDDPQLHLDAAKKNSGKTVQRLANRPAIARARLRIAYLSIDFREHPVAFQAVELFERHDHGRFETYGICLLPGEPSPSGIRERLKGAFDHFVRPGDRTDYEIAQVLAGQQIDIAIELGGYTERARPRILAYRPAPIAATYLGYPGTLGADYIDYLIADGCVIPPEYEAFYTEKIVRLPGCYMPADTRNRTITAPPSRTEAGLPETGFVFCAFNNSFKMTPEMFDIWMRLLHAVDGSVLWLNVHDPAVQNNLRAEAKARNISPERLIIAGRTDSREENFARLALADLYLDTHPYGAHATASDFLWAGVPLITMMGKSFASRVAGSMLTVLSKEELIAGSLDDYEAKALGLARAPEKLAAIRSTLAKVGAGSALFDMKRLCRHLESAYETMWDAHFAGRPPECFSVNP